MKALKNLKKTRKKTGIPSNVILLASHGSAEVPNQLKKYLDPRANKRILRNFSDFATQSLLKKFPNKSFVVPKYGRLAGDPNRDINNNDFFRFTDFGNIPIWNEKFQHKFSKRHRQWKKKLADFSRNQYFEQIFERLESALKDRKNKNKPILLFDIHDTGNLILGRDFSHDKLRQEFSGFTMPQIIFSNVDNKTADSKLLDHLQKKSADFFGISTDEIKTNTYFKGGYVTQFFGGVLENSRLEKLLKKYKRTAKDIQVIQIELNRELYMDEAKQTILPQIGKIRSGLEKMVESAAKFSV